MNIMKDVCMCGHARWCHIDKEGKFIPCTECKKCSKFMFSFLKQSPIIRVETPEKKEDKSQPWCNLGGTE